MHTLLFLFLYVVCESTATREQGSSESGVVQRAKEGGGAFLGDEMSLTLDTEMRGSVEEPEEVLATEAQRGVEKEIALAGTEPQTEKPRNELSDPPTSELVPLSEMEELTVTTEEHVEQAATVETIEATVDGVRGDAHDAEAATVREDEGELPPSETEEIATIETQQLLLEEPAVTTEEQAEANSNTGVLPRELSDAHEQVEQTATVREDEGELPPSKTEEIATTETQQLSLKEPVVTTDEQAEQAANTEALPHEQVEQAATVETIEATVDGVRGDAHDAEAATVREDERELPPSETEEIATIETKQLSLEEPAVTTEEQAEQAANSNTGVLPHEQVEQAATVETIEATVDKRVREEQSDLASPEMENPITVEEQVEANSIAGRDRAATMREDEGELPPPEIEKTTTETQQPSLEEPAVTTEEQVEANSNTGVLPHELSDAHEQVEQVAIVETIVATADGVREEQSDLASPEMEKPATIETQQFSLEEPAVTTEEMTSPVFEEATNTTQPEELTRDTAQTTKKNINLKTSTAPVPAVVKKQKAQNEWKNSLVAEEFFGQRFPLIQKDNGVWAVTEAARRILNKVEGNVHGVVCVGESRSGVSSFLNAFKYSATGNKAETMSGFKTSDPSTTATKGTQGAWGMLIDTANITVNLNEDITAVLLIDVQRITLSGDVADQAALLAAVVPVASNIVTVAWADTTINSYLMHFTITSSLAKSISGGSIVGSLSEPAFTLLTASWPSLLVVSQGTTPISNLKTENLMVYYPGVSVKHLPRPTVSATLLSDLSLVALEECSFEYSTSLHEIVRDSLLANDRTATGSVILEVLDKVFEQSSETLHLYPRIPTPWQAWVISSLDGLKRETIAWGRAAIARCIDTLCDSGVKRLGWKSDGDEAANHPTEEQLEEFHSIVLETAMLMFDEATNGVVGEGEKTRVNETKTAIAQSLNGFSLIAARERKSGVKSSLESATEQQIKSLEEQLNAIDLTNTNEQLRIHANQTLREALNKLNTNFARHRDFASELEAAKVGLEAASTRFLVAVQTRNDINRTVVLQSFTEEKTRLFRKACIVVNPMPPGEFSTFSKKIAERVTGEWLGATEIHQWASQHDEELVRFRSKLSFERDRKIADNDGLIAEACEDAVSNAYKEFVSLASVDDDLTMPHALTVSVYSDKISAAVVAAKRGLESRFKGSDRIGEAVARLSKGLESFASQTIYPKASVKWESLLTSVFICTEGSTLNSTKWRLAVSKPHVKRILKTRAADCFVASAASLPLSRGLADINSWVDSSPRVVEYAWLDTFPIRHACALFMFSLFLSLSLSPLYWEDIMKHL